MELVAMESSGVKRKSGSMEDEALAPLGCSRVGKNDFINMELWNRSEQKTQTRTPARQRESGEKTEGFANLSRLTEAQALQQLVRIVEEKSQQIHRNFMCWRSVPGVYLKMILGCIVKIPFSALNLKVLLEPGQREVALWKMLQLSEFVAGIDKDEVVGDNRCSNTTPWP